ncbi:MAG: GH92 family glycosyl hydrolase [Bacteroidota bacterium]
MKCRYILSLILLPFIFTSCKKKTTDVATNFETTKYVNPFIGTNEYDGGRTQPGAMVPNGMVTLTPANIYRDTTASKGPSTGYTHGNSELFGFTHLNLNGVGCHEAGSITIMPYSGNTSFLPLERKSTYSKEIASPGFYKTYLDDHAIEAELTTTLRTGISRFTFEKEGPAHFILDLAFSTSHSKEGAIEFVSNDEVTGYKKDGLFCGCPNGREVFFVMKMNKKAINTSLIKNYKIVDAQKVEGKVGVDFEFDMKEGEQLIVKVGISHVSIENARENLETEQPQFDFDRTLATAKDTWENMLSRIKVKGGTEDDKVKFYTAVYRTLLSPFVLEDVNGQYPAMNGEEILTVEKGHHRYTHYSLWDTYRTLHPFLTLFYPELQDDMTKSLVDMYKESDWLPLHELRSEEVYVMVGDPTVSVISDSYAKGLRGFDDKAAFEGMLKNASYQHQVPNPIRPCMEEYKRLGYIPFECDNEKYVPYTGTVRKGVWGSVSSTLEYNYSDWCVAQMAGYMGESKIQEAFTQRGKQYKNLYDAETGFFRPKLSDGTWADNFDPLAGLKEGTNRAQTKGKGFVEGCAWQYLFFVPHDVNGLIELVGGERKFTKRLQECFDKNYFDMSNEPDINFPYLFNYVAGEEWRTQTQVRKCIDQYFKNAPDGLPGNDDAGTLSAWLAFSMMGIYPVNPGEPVYQLTSPVFDEIEVQLSPKYHSGKSLVISTSKENNTQHLIERVSFNNKTISNFSINHEDLIKGGVLNFLLK